MPGDVKIAAPFLAFDRDYTEVFGGLTIRSYLTLNESEIAVAQFGNLLRALEEVEKSGAEEIVFTKNPLVGSAGQ
jgi:hypothetical protein